MIRSSALALLLVAAVAHADGDPREEAKAEFEAGQRADASHDYLSAVEHYESANRLLPHPFAMFNIAVDLERLGQLRESVNWYESYLRAENDTADRDRVRAHITELRGKPSPLSIRTMPPGARTTIDGKDAGQTPISMRIPGGAHKITVTLDGQRESRDVTADCGEPLDVQFSLRGQEGTLDVYGSPEAAIVTVDDVPLGRAPAKLVVAPGAHHVIVSSVGYASLDQQVSIRPDDTTPLSFQLQRASGSVDTSTTTSVIPSNQPVGWYLGSIAGGDARAKAGFFVEGEIGGRYHSWEGGFRIGETGGHTSWALLGRWEPEWRLRPYVAFGYSYVGSDAGVGFGVLLSAGLGLTVLKTASVDYVIKAEASIRSYMDNGASGGGSASNSYIAPLGIELEVVVKHQPKPTAAPTPAYAGPAYP
ncbi:MAG TPA: PEGA domain-containing protein [Kofleriaceae bacterium]|jgi:hypothetical protein